ncbi:MULTISPECIES: hypothetical protein [Acinetobacter]|jgi:hypothetical protein|uniref:hypothetical protein n=1 Tax=Acinetobacter TaxID=469 RepID=UPI001F167C5C|nr:hypothetical protein [Acinetobacter johnsonii]UJA00446.1 hypothetical protein GBN93_05490 [Acinetobacter johnsonii]
MKEKLGVFIFYTLILFGIIVLTVAFFKFDLLLFIISFFLVVCALLLKYEFKLAIIFWKESE